jgi:hypothetical protein
MKRSLLLNCAAAALWLGSTAVVPRAHAQGYMAFLNNGPGGTTVTAGEAASYMRAGADWDGATLMGGIAVPILMQASKVTTWRAGSDLHFKFVIPDRTTTAGGATLACGDRVIVQLDPTNAKGGNLSGSYFRYEVVIKDNLVNSVGKRIPQTLGPNVFWSASAATTASVTGFSAAANQYSFTLNIPGAEIGNPGANIGLALAIVNDLGHSHPSGMVQVNEATGHAFPVGMGLTKESDPGLTCGSSVPATEGATGNWLNPSTWGTGYFNTGSGTQDVTLSNAPAYWISNSLKLGLCSVTSWNQITPITSAANWDAVQQNAANNWYLYNPTGPCRMSIWINAQVAGAGTGVVQRRFLVVWGRPGIAPQDWFFAGLTEPVAVTAPATAVSFTWNNPPAVNFASHPCLRAYVLPETLTPGQIATLQAIHTQAELDAMEASYMVSSSTAYSAQMNFSNIGVGSCTDSRCGPLVTVRDGGGDATRWPRIALVGEAFAAQPGPAETQPDSVQNRARVFARAFGVAEPAPNRTYVYVEPIGGLGWSVPVQKDSLQLTFDVTNPRLAEKTFARGQVIEIPAPPRRILIALSTEAPRGVTPPAIDTVPLGRFASALMPPGTTDSVRLGVRPAAGGGDGIVPTGGLPWWVWLIIVLIILLLVIWLIRRRSGP